MKGIQRTIILVAVGAIAGGALATGVTTAIEVGAGDASITAPTWYGCLSARGGLSKVGTVAPTCPSKSRVMSWDSYPSNANGTPQCTGIVHIGIDLSGCDLVGADFSNANLENANLEAANLTDANLAGAQLNDTIQHDNGANLTDANLEGATVTGAYGVAANLTGADVRGDIFTDSNFGYANFTGANLTDVNFNSGFFDVNFTDANLSGAIVASPLYVAGVTWNHTTCPDGTNSDNDGDTCIDNLTPT